MGIHVNTGLAPQNEAYAHLDFSDVNNGENVQLNSIYDSRDKVAYLESNDDQATYGNLDWAGTQDPGTGTVPPYVNYDPTQAVDDDDAFDAPVSLDPSQ